MRRTRWTTVLACLTSSAVVTWATLDLLLRHRGWLPLLTPWAVLVAVGVGVVVLLAGLGVRRLRAHERTWMTPLGAAVTAAAAQASALVGAVTAGAYAGELGVALLAPRSPAMSDLAWSAGGCLLACLAWCAAGLLVEHWCAIDMSDDDDDPASGSGSVPDTGARA